MTDYAPFKPGKRRYRLILQADHRDVPTIIRLRQLLKRLLRSFGFTCLECIDITNGVTSPCTVNTAGQRCDIPAQHTNAGAGTPSPSTLPGLTGNGRSAK